MSTPPSVNYTSFSKDDLLSLIESKVNTINLYENEMQSYHSKIESVKKEKQELATLNMTLSHGFSTLEVFIVSILGQKAMKDLRDQDNNYDLEKLKSKFYESHSDNQTLRENTDNLIAKLEHSALQEEKYKIITKKVEEWGGENYIESCISQVKTLQLESDSKDVKIKELDDRLSIVNENKGNTLLNMLNDVEEAKIDKSKANLLLDVSHKSNQILELKDKLEEAMQNLKIAKVGNPFDRAGGSDDEDNKERIVQRNSTGSPSKNTFGRRTIGIKIDQDDYDELQKQCQEEQAKSIKLQEDVNKLTDQVKNSKIIARKLLVGIFYL
jgi:hypothetical protein